MQSAPPCREGCLLEAGAEPGARELRGGGGGSVGVPTCCECKLGGPAPQDTVSTPEKAGVGSEGVPMSHRGSQFGKCLPSLACCGTWPGFVGEEPAGGERLAGRCRWCAEQGQANCPGGPWESANLDSPLPPGRGPWGALGACPLLPLVPGTMDLVLVCTLLPGGAGDRTEMWPWLPRGRSEWQQPNSDVDLAACGVCE